MTNVATTHKLLLAKWHDKTILGNFKGIGTSEDLKTIWSPSNNRIDISSFSDDCWARHQHSNRSKSSKIDDSDSWQCQLNMYNSEETFTTGNFNFPDSSEQGLYLAVAGSKSVLDSQLLLMSFVNTIQKRQITKGPVINSGRNDNVN